MRKIKTIMAFLTVMTMTMGAMSVTANALETAAVNNVETTSDKDFLDNACEAIMDFIIENDIAAFPCTYEDLNAVTVTYANYEEMERTADALKAYMKEKGMGNVNIIIYGPTDPALEDAVKLINEFIHKAELHASAWIDTDIQDAVTVNIYNWWEADETEASIKAFLNENDIDKDKVMFLVFEDGSSHIFGDANCDHTINVRDCAYIAKKLAEGKGDSLPVNADYNRDGNKNVRDAAAIAKFLAKK